MGPGAPRQVVLRDRRLFSRETETGRARSVSTKGHARREETGVKAREERGRAVRGSESSLSACRAGPRPRGDSGGGTRSPPEELKWRSRNSCASPIPKRDRSGGDQCRERRLGGGVPVARDATSQRSQTGERRKQSGEKANRDPKAYLFSAYELLDEEGDIARRHLGPEEQAPHAGWPCWREETGEGVRTISRGSNRSFSASPRLRPCASCSPRYGRAQLVEPEVSPRPQTTPGLPGASFALAAPHIDPTCVVHSPHRLEGQDPAMRGPHARRRASVEVGIEDERGAERRGDTQRERPCGVPTPLFSAPSRTTNPAHATKVLKGRPFRVARRKQTLCSEEGREGCYAEGSDWEKKDERESPSLFRAATGRREIASRAPHSEVGKPETSVADSEVGEGRRRNPALAAGAESGWEEHGQGSGTRALQEDLSADWGRWPCLGERGGNGTGPDSGESLQGFDSARGEREDRFISPAISSSSLPSYQELQGRTRAHTGSSCARLWPQENTLPGSHRPSASPSRHPLRQSPLEAHRLPSSTSPSTRVSPQSRSQQRVFSESERRTEEGRADVSEKLAALVQEAKAFQSGENLNQLRSLQQAIALRLRENLREQLSAIESLQRMHCLEPATLRASPASVSSPRTPFAEGVLEAAGRLPRVRETGAAEREGRSEREGEGGKSAREVEQHVASCLAFLQTQVRKEQERQRALLAKHKMLLEEEERQNAEWREKAIRGRREREDTKDERETAGTQGDPARDGWRCQGPPDPSCRKQLGERAEREREKEERERHDLLARRFQESDAERVERQARQSQPDAISPAEHSAARPSPAFGSGEKLHAPYCRPHSALSSSLPPCRHLETQVDAPIAEKERRRRRASLGDIDLQRGALQLATESGREEERETQLAQLELQRRQLLALREERLRMQSERRRLQDARACFLQRAPQGGVGYREERRRGGEDNEAEEDTQSGREPTEEGSFLGESEMQSACFLAKDSFHTHTFRADALQEDVDVPPSLYRWDARFSELLFEDKRVGDRAGKASEEWPLSPSRVPQAKIPSTSSASVAAVSGFPRAGAMVQRKSDLRECRRLTRERVAARRRREQEEAEALEAELERRRRNLAKLSEKTRKLVQRHLQVSKSFSVDADERGDSQRHQSVGPVLQSSVWPFFFPSRSSKPESIRSERSSLGGVYGGPPLPFLPPFCCRFCFHKVVVPSTLPSSVPVLPSRASSLAPAATAGVSSVPSPDSAVLPRPLSPKSQERTPSRHTVSGGSGSTHVILLTPTHVRGPGPSAPPPLSPAVDGVPFPSPPLHSRCICGRTTASWALQSPSPPATRGALGDREAVKENEWVREGGEGGEELVRGGSEESRASHAFSPKEGRSGPEKAQDKWECRMPPGQNNLLKAVAERRTHDRKGERAGTPTGSLSPRSKNLLSPYGDEGDSSLQAARDLLEKEMMQRLVSKQKSYNLSPSSSCTSSGDAYVSPSRPGKFDEMVGGPPVFLASRTGPERTNRECREAKREEPAEGEIQGEELPSRIRMCGVLDAATSPVQVLRPSARRSTSSSEREEREERGKDERAHSTDRNAHTHREGDVGRKGRHFQGAAHPTFRSHRQSPLPTMYLSPRAPNCGDTSWDEHQRGPVRRDRACSPVLVRFPESSARHAAPAPRVGPQSRRRSLSSPGFRESVRGISPPSPVSKAPGVSPLQPLPCGFSSPPLSSFPQGFAKDTNRDGDALRFSPGQEDLAPRDASVRGNPSPIVVSPSLLSSSGSSPHPGGFAHSVERKRDFSPLPRGSVWTAGSGESSLTPLPGSFGPVVPPPPSPPGCGVFSQASGTCQGGGFVEEPQGGDASPERRTQVEAPRSSDAGEDLVKKLLVGIYDVIGEQEAEAFASEVAVLRGAEGHGEDAQAAETVETILRSLSRFRERRLSGPPRPDKAPAGDARRGAPEDQRQVESRATTERRRTDAGASATPGSRVFPTPQPSVVSCQIGKEAGDRPSQPRVASAGSPSASPRGERAASSSRVRPSSSLSPARCVVPPRASPQGSNATLRSSLASFPEGSLSPSPHAPLSPFPSAGLLSSPSPVSPRPSSSLGYLSSSLAVAVDAAGEKRAERRVPAPLQPGALQSPRSPRPARHFAWSPASGVAPAAEGEGDKPRGSPRKETPVPSHLSGPSLDHKELIGAIVEQVMARLKRERLPLYSRKGEKSSSRKVRSREREEGRENASAESRLSGVSVALGLSGSSVESGELEEGEVQDAEKLNVPSLGDDAASHQAGTPLPVSPPSVQSWKQPSSHSLSRQSRQTPSCSLSALAYPLQREDVPELGGLSASPDLLASSASGRGASFPVRWSDETALTPVLSSGLICSAAVFPTSPCGVGAGVSRPSSPLSPASAARARRPEDREEAAGETETQGDTALGVSGGTASAEASPSSVRSSPHIQPRRGRAREVLGEPVRLSFASPSPDGERDTWQRKENLASSSPPRSLSPRQRQLPLLSPASIPASPTLAQDQDSKSSPLDKSPKTKEGSMSPLRDPQGSPRRPVSPREALAARAEVETAQLAASPRSRGERGATEEATEEARGCRVVVPEEGETKGDAAQPQSPAECTEAGDLPPHDIAGVDRGPVVVSLRFYPKDGQRGDSLSVSLPDSPQGAPGPQATEENCGEAQAAEKATFPSPFCLSADVQVTSDSAGDDTPLDRDVEPGEVFDLGEGPENVYVVGMLRQEDGREQTEETTARGKREAVESATGETGERGQVHAQDKCRILQEPDLLPDTQKLGGSSPRSGPVSQGGAALFPRRDEGGGLASFEMEERVPPSHPSSGFDKNGPHSLVPVPDGDRCDGLRAQLPGDNGEAANVLPGSLTLSPRRPAQSGLSLPSGKHICEKDADEETDGVPRVAEAELETRADFSRERGKLESASVAEKAPEGIWGEEEISSEEEEESEVGDDFLQLNPALLPGPLRKSNQVVDSSPEAAVRIAFALMIVKRGGELLDALVTTTDTQTDKTLYREIHALVNHCARESPSAVCISRDFVELILDLIHDVVSDPDRCFVSTNRWQTEEAQQRRELKQKAYSTFPTLARFFSAEQDRKTFTWRELFEWVYSAASLGFFAPLSAASPSSWHRGLLRDPAFKPVSTLPDLVGDDVMGLAFSHHKGAESYVRHLNLVSHPECLTIGDPRHGSSTLPSHSTLWNSRGQADAGIPEREVQRQTDENERPTVGNVNVVVCMSPRERSEQGSSPCCALSMSPRSPLSVSQREARDRRGEPAEASARTEERGGEHDTRQQGPLLKEASLSPTRDTDHGPQFVDPFSFSPQTGRERKEGLAGLPNSTLSSPSSLLFTCGEGSQTTKQTPRLPPYPTNVLGKTIQTPSFSPRSSASPLSSSRPSSPASGASSALSPASPSSTAGGDRQTERGARKTYRCEGQARPGTAACAPGEAQDMHALESPAPYPSALSHPPYSSAEELPTTEGTARKAARSYDSGLSVSPIRGLASGQQRRHGVETEETLRASDSPSQTESDGGREKELRFLHGDLDPEKQHSSSLSSPAFTSGGTSFRLESVSLPPLPFDPSLSSSEGQEQTGSAVSSPSSRTEPEEADSGAPLLAGEEKRDRKCQESETATSREKEVKTDERRTEGKEGTVLRAAGPRHSLPSCFEDRTMPVL
ncbi:conserved hypothetical protein [Neospora caninum Liverpool]|uniref:Uncharacterized protein n=1 Tax=Neospora caninum (strain Liverpool) TaxID=572307 RepID=F0V8G7_NEOCL|nr:conserved hypothetical protein [Neospora caninum Liverpool]CBZ50008.1 conserved hypothetical protein [Neospora caninum Liverpool]|eukprot:XP_003880043.1 conserved hypothetical protein [Neospora caninum Liverpool]